VKCDESEGRATNALQLLAMSMGAFCALLQNSFVCCKRDAKKKKAAKGVKESQGESGRKRVEGGSEAKRRHCLAFCNIMSSGTTSAAAAVAELLHHYNQSSNNETIPQTLVPLLRFVAAAG